MVIYLESQLPGISSDLPENGAGHSFYSPIRSCTRWGLPSRQVTLPLVRSYRTVSSLPQKCGGLFSVALSLRSPSLAVSQHPALWSPDFPHLHPFVCAAAIICSTYFSYLITAYTSKQLPPTNSLHREFFGSSSLLIPRKYSRNLSSRFAS